jgi:hypothetical protein
MLFILAVDVLQQMIRAANNLLLQSFPHKIQEAVVNFQYADDTSLILSVDNTTIITTKLLLSIFCKISGLSIDFSKSYFVPFNLNLQEIDMVARILECPNKSLSITYLGLPLTIKQPGRVAFQLLIESVES